MTVGAEVQAAVVDLLQRIYRDHGLTITEIRADWMDVIAAGHEAKILGLVRVGIENRTRIG